MDVEVEPPPGGAIRFDWMEPLDPQVIVRYRIPGVGHADRPVFDLVARLLRGGNAAGQCVAERIALDTDACRAARRAMRISRRSNRRHSHAVERLRSGPIDEAALARAETRAALRLGAAANRNAAAWLRNSVPLPRQMSGERWGPIWKRVIAPQPATFSAWRSGTSCRRIS